MDISPMVTIGLLPNPNKDWSGREMRLKNDIPF